ncbi:hypothetical protein GGR51DRAFT_571551 [Nemania sp. FL0031]|nr:hypothetical protein GGR51DRAFT_571551 [Nemania sp. FL0031]
MLQGYFSLPTYVLNLVNQNGKLSAIKEIYDPQLQGNTSPRIQIVDTEPKQPPMSSGLMAWPGIYPTLYSPNCSPEGAAARNEQRLFLQTGFPVQKSRKSRERNRFLSKIEASGQFTPPFPTSELVGLVVWDDDETCLMGLLLEYIEGDTLQWRSRTGSTALKAKWFSQLSMTVKQLHEAGLVWGDVKPDNVMINEAGDAVVIDFGEGYRPEYVSHELQGTAEGDLMGLKTIAAELGVEHE